MRIFLKSKVVEWFIGLTASYWLFAPFFINTSVVPTAISAALMALWFGLTIIYWRVVWLQSRNPFATLGAKLYMLGIASLALAITGIFAWSSLYQILNQPEWMQMHILRGWFLWIFLIATLSLLMAGVAGEKSILGGEGWSRLLIFVGIGIAITIVVIYLAGGFPMAGSRN